MSPQMPNLGKCSFPSEDYQFVFALSKARVTSSRLLEIVISNMYLALAPT